jgi:hypothetical protein
MNRSEAHGGSRNIEARASEFIAQAEWLISASLNREDAFELIFGLGGPYMSLFPSIDDRLALRDLPARGHVFKMLSRLSASGHK